MTEDSQTALRSTLISLNETITPMHEWLAGQRSHFLSLGYTEDESRAMAAVTYVFVFGTAIRNPSGDGDED